MRKDQTESAFPAPLDDSHYYGITKREYFAAAAMAAILSNWDLMALIQVKSTLAETAFRHADEMIQESSK